MKLSVIAIAALLVQSISAADLTGHWVAAQPGADGQTRETSLWLKSDGDRLSGYISTRMGDSPIAEGKVIGGQISFVVIADAFDQTGRLEYTGTLTRDGILLRMPAFGGRAGRGGGPGRGGQLQEILAKRVSTEEPKPLPPPPPKLTLPPAKEVAYNGLAKVPPMGWNSWNQFRAQVSDRLVRETADAMVRNGMKDAGYVYVNLDDTWQGKRDEMGNIHPNDRFPDMKALADYIHGKGLKFGVYSSPGPKTCAGYEGSLQHEEQDAKTFAAWGADYLKYDWCSARTVYDQGSMRAVFAKMGEALLAAHRPMVYSFSAALPKAPEWASAAGGNLWRTGSFRDDYASMAADGFDNQESLEKFAAPGHWNDPDMLHIGQGGMNETEYRTHFSLWCILAAPLLAGNDLRNVPPGILEILTNKEAIAVDQDSLGRQGSRVKKDGGLEVWAKPLSGGAYAVGLFNRSESSARITVHAADLGFERISRLRDLWAHADLSVAGEPYSADVPSHGVVLLRITGK